MAYWSTFRALLVVMLVVSVAITVLNVALLRLRKQLTFSQKSMKWLVVSTIAQCLRYILLLVTLSGWEAWVGACLGHVSAVCTFAYMLHLNANVFATAYKTAFEPVPQWVNKAARANVVIVSGSVVIGQTTCAAIHFSQPESGIMLVFAILGTAVLVSTNVCGYQLIKRIRLHNTRLEQNIRQTRVVSMDRFKRELLLNDAAMVVCIFLAGFLLRRYYLEPRVLPYQNLPETYWLLPCLVWFLVNTVSSVVAWFGRCGKLESASRSSRRRTATGRISSQSRSSGGSRRTQLVNPLASPSSYSRSLPSPRGSPRAVLAAHPLGERRVGNSVTRVSVVREESELAEGNSGRGTLVKVVGTKDSESSERHSRASGRSEE